MKYSHITRNIQKIRNDIADILDKNNRGPEDCKLLIVTKNRSNSEIKAVIDSGQFMLGENKVQELRCKLDFFEDHKGLEWHMIGHLQSNKFKYIADRVSLIHSADSLKLLRFMNNHCKKHNIKCNIMLEFNVSKEPTKYGFSPEMKDQLELILPELHELNIMGLMTMAPFTSDQETIRAVFRSIKELSLSFLKKNLNIGPCLSMGMSNDYKIAIEEGSSIVRIGSIIFDK